MNTNIISKFNFKTGGQRNGFSVVNGNTGLVLNTKRTSDNPYEVLEMGKTYNLKLREGESVKLCMYYNPEIEAVRVACMVSYAAGFTLTDHPLSRLSKETADIMSEAVKLISQTETGLAEEEIGELLYA